MMIKVLVVDDNIQEGKAMALALGEDPDIKIVGILASGEEALRIISTVSPDVVVMDTIMPGMDGIQATSRIMASHPVPVVLVTSRLDPQIAQISFKALDAGAVSCLKKPGMPGSTEYAVLKTKLLLTVKAMSEIKVIRRRETPRISVTAAKHPPPPNIPTQNRKLELVAIGASVGGPPVIHSIISGLPASFPIPIVAVQHILNGFSMGMVNWMNETVSGPRSFLASSGEELRPGRVYFAPDGCQMKILPDRKVLLTSDDPENGFRPSVSYTFRSIAVSFADRAIGVLLTGMGRDGADGLKRMKDSGALTIAQDQESCVVFGMPGEAVRLGAVTRLLSPDKIPEVLMAAAGLTNS